jgi:regulation of enolase protein 1 (concanavalin A-like superfamily)
MSTLDVPGVPFPLTPSARSTWEVDAPDRRVSIIAFPYSERVSRIDDVYAYHASIDGVRWQLVRAFVLALEGVSPSIGLEAQSPTGEGCAVTFSNMSFTSTRLADMRDGT